MICIIKSQHIGRYEVIPQPEGHGAVLQSALFCPHTSGVLILLSAIERSSPAPRFTSSVHRKYWSVVFDYECFHDNQHGVHSNWSCLLVHNSH